VEKKKLRPRRKEKSEVSKKLQEEKGYLVTPITQKKQVHSSTKKLSKKYSNSTVHRDGKRTCHQKGVGSVQRQEKEERD